MHKQLVLIFLFFFFLLAPNQMGGVNERTTALAITKHLMIASNLLTVALLFHSGRSCCSRCLSLMQEFLISHMLPGKATCLSSEQKHQPRLQKSSLLTMSNSSKKCSEHFFTKPMFLLNICSSLLKASWGTQGSSGHVRQGGEGSPEEVTFLLFGQVNRGIFQWVLLLARNSPAHTRTNTSDKTQGWEMPFSQNQKEVLHETSKMKAQTSNYFNIG